MNAEGSRECCSTAESQVARKICSCHWSSIRSSCKLLGKIRWQSASSYQLPGTSGLSVSLANPGMESQKKLPEQKQMWGQGDIPPLRWASWAWEIQCGCSQQVLEAVSLNRSLTQFIPGCQEHKIQGDFEMKFSIHKVINRNTSIHPSDWLCQFHIFKILAEKLKYLRGHPMAEKRACSNGLVPRV